MYKRNVMFKKNRAGIVSGIASKMFDTINKIAVENEERFARDEAASGAASRSAVTDVTVSIPNAQKPLKFTTAKPYEICVYQVRTDGLYPFLLFLLTQTVETKDEFGFIPLPSSFATNPQKIKYAATAYLKTLLPGTFAYSGFAETIDTNILILHYIPEIQFEHAYLWATPFEIIHKGKVMHSAVGKSVIRFFQMHPDFLILRTADNREYESPMIGYSVTTIDEIEEMDIYREIVIPAFGKCYYLYTELPEKSEKNIMRIVFFAGKMILLGEKESYDSLLCTFNNTKRYLLTNYNQHVVL
jgi:hypothetical protein